nr:MAG TPA: hypothetical protein [Caudoviricetes sp.]
MTNFEREEQEILTEAASTKTNIFRMIKDQLLTEEEGYLWLNDKLLMLQERWFQLHRKLVEG